MKQLTSVRSALEFDILEAGNITLLGFSGNVAAAFIEIENGEIHDACTGGGILQNTQHVNSINGHWKIDVEAPKYTFRLDGAVVATLYCDNPGLTSSGPAWAAPPFVSTASLIDNLTYVEF